MRVCMATTSYPRRADDLAGHFVRALAHRLAAAGVEVTIVAPGAADAPVHERDGGVTVHRFTYFLPRRWQRLAYGGGIPYNLRHDRLAAVNIPAFAARFAAVLVAAARRADVVHCHWSPPAALAAATRPIHRRPIVLTAHGSDLRIDRGPIRTATRYAVRAADRVLSPSHEYAAKAQALRRREPAARFAPIGMDLPPRDRIDAAVEDRRGHAGPVRLVTVGRLIPERRFDVLLEAVAAVRREGRPLTLTIVGDGPQRQALQRLAGQLEIDHAVRFVGGVAPGAVGGYLLDADVYVSPTTIDNFGTAVVEAAAHGLPAIVTRVGFPAELVQPPHGGWIVTPADRGAMTEAIGHAVDDRGKLPAMGRAMRDRVEALGVDFETVVRDTLAEYRAAIAARRSP